MQKWLLVFVLLLSFNGFAAETIPWLLMPTSHVKTNLRVCYRWMSKREMNAWISKETPQPFAIFEAGRNHLDRGGKIQSGIYCWHHPTGAMRGGPGEYYGDYIARIEFIDDVVIFDRNLRTYSTGNGSSVPEDMKLEIDSEVFYANYKTKDFRFPWFQEYIIKNPKAVKSFSFSGEILKAEVRQGFKELMDGTLSWENTHMYGTEYCPFLTTEADGSWITFQTDSRRYYCQDTRQNAKEVIEGLESFWAQANESTVSNRDARKEHY